MAVFLACASSVPCANPQKSALGTSESWTPCANPHGRTQGALVVMGAMWKYTTAEILNKGSKDILYRKIHENKKSCANGFFHICSPCTFKSNGVQLQFGVVGISRNISLSFNQGVRLSLGV